MDFVCACVTPAQANDYFDDYFTVKIFDILGINWREERVMVINDDKGGLIFFRIKGKEEREREESKGEKSRRNSAFLLWESCAITLPWELPVATPLRLCPSSFLLPADRRISHDPPLSLSLLSNPSLSLVCAKAPLPNLFSRVENLMVVEGQFVLLWEPRRDRTIKPRIRNWIVITLDGLEEEILFFFFKKSGSISRFKGRDFFSPTICLNYEKMERKYLKEI